MMTLILTIAIFTASVWVFNRVMGHAAALTQTGLKMNRYQVAVAVAPSRKVASLNTKCARALAA